MMVLFYKTSPYVIAVYEAIDQCEKSDDKFQLAYSHGNRLSQHYLTNAANIIQKLHFETLYEVSQGKIVTTLQGQSSAHYGDVHTLQPFLTTLQGQSSALYGDEYYYHYGYHYYYY